MPTATPKEPTPRTHGGRRPGAGAPRGNLNAVRHGYRNQDLIAAAVLVLAYPGVARLIDAIIRSNDRRRFRTLLAQARRLNRTDPDRARTIKLEAAHAIIATVDQIQNALSDAQEKPRTIKQSRSVRAAG